MSLPSFAQAFRDIDALPPSRKRPTVRVKHESPPPDDPLPSPLKRRRVTVSGQPLRIDVCNPPNDPPASTPISPVVMGLSVQRDNPVAIEQVRSMINVKQKQQALIDQRRGSAAAILQDPPPQHSLPPPPISFARRRAAVFGAKKKPADIVISPRDAHIQPSIQSAPPVPAQFSRTMAIPRLPTIPHDNPRRVPANVPPTPTRLNPNRSPPAPSVPISASLVPPTPTSLHRPGYQGDKAAFLAPFDLFYDALNDSKQLKSWLADQLQKSHTLVQSLAHQQERINETVESLVEKRVNAEMSALRRRVDDLEDALRSQNRPNAIEPYTFPPPSHDPPSRLRSDIHIPRPHSSPGHPLGQERVENGPSTRTPPHVYRDRDHGPIPPTPPSRPAVPSVSRQSSSHSDRPTATRRNSVAMAPADLLGS